MASHIYPTLGFGLPQELGSNEIIKRSRAYIVNPGGRKQEIIRETSFNLKPQHLEPWKSFSALSKSNEFDSTMMKPRLIGVHESTKPLLDLMVDGNILFSSIRAEINDMVSIATEFHMLRNSTRWRKLSRLVPQFQRFDSEVVIENLQLPEVKLDADTQAPPKSPEKTRLKPSPKKQNPKIRDREKDLHTRNHLHACESLISLMLGSEQHKQNTMLSLKKSRGDLSDFLTQFSIGIAGTGMAVFFSVACKIASRRVPFCENKFFDSALSLSLVLLSWAVSRLRKAINGVNKKAINEEEIRNRVERRIKEVYFRAAIVIAIVALRFG
ncbi:hypothetical protein V5N11_030169 [Cardamine amara subsp. amara]|uniref:ATP synthase protein MI25 n=1 Tax=Cardamine amara subsp. amara TaxID=228776 RepID=A0ABD1BJ65_CARAN